MYEHLQERAGFGDDTDLMSYVRERYGEEEADSIRQRVKDGLDQATDARYGPLARQLSSGTAAQARDRAWRRERPRQAGDQVLEREAAPVEVAEPRRGCRSTSPNATSSAGRLASVLEMI